MFRQRYGNKYGAKSHVYEGIAYHSKKEAGYAAELDLRLKAGDILKWERQIRVALEVNGYHITNYYVDFLIYHTDMTLEYVEVKGFETPEWKLKWKLFEATYSNKPNTRLTVVK